MKIKRIFESFSSNNMDAVSTEKLVAFAKKLEEAQHSQQPHDFYNPEPEECYDSDRPAETNKIQCDAEIIRV